MLNLISCELLKLKRSKMVLISVAGVLSTPLLMLIEALQTHFDKPEIIFTLSDIYSDSVLYIMLLVNIMIYVAIAAYLFSREYTESTLKTILPIPISRTKLLIGKFCTLLLWIVMLTLVTWAGIFIVCGLYDAVFTLEGYSLLVAIVWLPKFLFGSILMFLTVSPFVFVAMKTKGFVAPMIGSAVIVMGSAALSNQEWGALYPWTATYFLVQGKLQSTGYPTLLSVSIIILVSAVGFLTVALRSCRICRFTCPTLSVIRIMLLLLLLRFFSDKEASAPFLPVQIPGSYLLFLLLSLVNTDFHPFLRG